MRTFDRTLLLTLWGAVVLTVGSAMAAETSPSIQLRLPFVNLLAEDPTATSQIDLHGRCVISGEQAMRIERDTSDPCLAADAAPGGVCFDRLGLGALQSRRASLPHDGGRRCVE